MAQDGEAPEDAMEPFTPSYLHDIVRVIPGYDAIFNMAVPLLSRGAPEQGRLLVVGCGGGQEMLVFSRTLPGWCITGVDPSPSMVALAEDRLKVAGLYDRAETIVGVVADLPQGEAFDAATCVLTMQFEKDDGSKLELLRGIAERMKRGGGLVVVDLCGEAGSEAFEGAISAWQAHALNGGMSEEYMERFRADVEAREPFAFVSEGRERELLAQAGFRVGFRFYQALIYSGWIAFKA